MRFFSLRNIFLNSILLIGYCLSTHARSELIELNNSVIDSAKISITTRKDIKGVHQVRVPAGCFMMGADDAALLINKLNAPNWVSNSLGYEDPQRKTCLTQNYWIDSFEVSNESFQQFVLAGGYTTPAYWSESGLVWLKKQILNHLPLDCEKQIPRNPRVCVTWFEAEAYARWRGGRLPTEAEWEYAARSPNSFNYPWGNEWDEKKANVVKSQGLRNIGSYPNGKSWVGAYDLTGNAMEWVQDWLSKDYPKQKVRDNPPGPDIGIHKIEKGGWWGSNAFVARASYKHFEDTPDYQDHHIGFRIVTESKSSN